jgi:hypothetical protein
MTATKNQVLKKKREREGVSRKTKTLLNNAYKLGKLPGIDIALTICNRGRYLAYKSIDRESFPPTMAEIVSEARISLKYFTNIHKRKRLIPFPRFSYRAILRRTSIKAWIGEVCEANNCDVKRVCSSLCKILPSYKGHSAFKVVKEMARL